MSTEKQNLTIVVFGVTGNLYKIKLVGALARLFKKGILGFKFNIVGFGRKALSDTEFQKLTKDPIKKQLSKEKLKKFLSHFSYIQGDLNNLKDFKNLNLKLKDAKNKLFYLAIPPELYSATLRNISKSKLDKGAKILVEKPFGRSLKEAKKLDKLTKRIFKQNQIFHVDHYLAKEPMQKLMMLHFQNKNLKKFFGNKKPERVRIIFHEKISIGKRQSFDKVGTFRDVGQNHMLEILAIAGMEYLKKKGAIKVQNARKAVLEDTKLYAGATMVRAQYKGYLDEPGVKKSSKTETFFRVVLTVSNKKWKGIPFELEGGKALSRSETSLQIYFRGANKPKTFLISSDKKQGYDPYEKVFYDCLLGDHTLFVSSGEIMAEWRIAEKIMKKWKNIPLVIYNKGSKGEDIQ